MVLHYRIHLYNNLTWRIPEKKVFIFRNIRYASTSISVKLKRFFANLLYAYPIEFFKIIKKYS
jgi:hypothetical protein